MHFNKKVIQRAMPIYIGYLFLGLACGILGQQAHIAPVEAFIMSILAYSGSGQFICIAMLMDNASLFSILVTNFMVSLRYMFFSTAMYPHIKDCSLPYSVIFAQNITDELVAMFLGIWSGYLHDTVLLIAGLLGGILSVLLSFVVPFKLHIVLATLIVSVIACWLEVKHSKKEEANS